MTRTNAMRTQRILIQSWLLCLTALALQLSAISKTSAAAFVPTGSMNNSRAFHAATLLQDGKVLVAGGANNTVELYDPLTGTWAATANMKKYRGRNTATLLADGKVLAARGYYDVFTGLASLEVFDPVTTSWAEFGMSSTDGFGHPLFTGGDSHTATLLGNGKVLFAGGWDPINHHMQYSYVYDPSNPTNYGSSVSLSLRMLHSATLLPDGRVLIVGGETNGTALGTATAELYDPVTGTSTNTGSMGTGRKSHTATLLPNGKVLVAGGDYGLASAELYDPATGTWTATGSMSIARASHTATLLPNGKVLVVGGNGYDPSAELYDPATGTWSATKPLNTARRFHTATLLPSGDVLIAGGWSSDSISTSSAELYQQYPALITCQRLAGSDLQFSYEGGIAGNSYALERSLTLAPADWIPQITNLAVESGTLLFTNTPVANTNNFWRIRSVP